MSPPSSTTVCCPYCTAKLDVSKNTLPEYVSTRCPHCKKQFNVFTLYRWLYEQIPLAKIIADRDADTLFKHFRIEASNEEEKEAIINFFNMNDFKNIFKRIVLDCIIYGISFLEWKKDENNNIRVLYINPADTNVRISRQHFDIIFSLETYDNIEFSSENIIHFSLGINLTYPDLGSSIYGYWFHKWYR